MRNFNKHLLKITNLFEPIWFLIGKLKTNSYKNTQNIKKILIFDFHNIGDIVILSGFIKSLKDIFPKSTITLVCGPWAEVVLKNNKLIDNFIFFEAPWVRKKNLLKHILSIFFIIFQLRKNTYDLGIDVRGDLRQIILLFIIKANRRISFDFMGRGLLTDLVSTNKKTINYLDYHTEIIKYLSLKFRSNKRFLKVHPQIYFSKKEEETIKFDTDYNSIGIHLGASLEVRRISNSLRFNYLDSIIKSNLNNYPAKFIYFLSDYDLNEEKKIISKLEMINNIRIIIWKGTLRELILKIKVLRKLYCLDSGPAHLAAAMGVELNIIYGPSDSKITKPLADKIQIIESNKPSCWPCNLKKCNSDNIQCCYKNRLKL